MDKDYNFRLREIRGIVLMVILTLVIGLSSLFFYFYRLSNQYINYDEKSDIDYKVLLKDNEFYKDNYLEKNKGYVSSLIDNIETQFKYDLNFDQKIKYKYSYKIVAEVDVSDSQSKHNIYHYSEDLKTHDLESHVGNLNVSETLSINYQQYNDIINRFKDVYDLSNTDAVLNVYLYVNVQNIEQSNSSSLMNKKVSGLSIPLTLNTVSIDIGNDIISNSNNHLALSRYNKYSWVLVLSIIYILLSVLYIIYLVLFMMKTRTAQMIYDKEIKSIMNNYDSYIQRISGSYDIGTSQVIKIESFSDMLEIRDTLKQPILMLENEEKNGTFFIIPATNSIIYTYALRVVDIKAKMDGNEIPTYDITEIPHGEFVKNKKYTDEYIKEQITMTSALPTVDEKNVIKGNKDKDRSLYDQLEKTSSFDIKEIKKAEKELKRKNKVSKNIKSKSKKKTSSGVKRSSSTKKSSKK